MNTASELRKSLADTLPAEQIDQIVAGAVERGDVENDEATGGLSPDIVKSLMGELRGSLEDVEYETTLIKSEGYDADIAHLDDDDDYIDVEATLNSVVKSANSTSNALSALVSQAAATDGALAKGVLALGQLTEHVLNQQSTLAKSQAAIAEQLNAVAAALRVPTPPRSVSGHAQRVPHPGEIVKSAAGGVAEKSDFVDADKLMSACITEQHRLSESGDPQAMHKSQQMASAISRLNSGVPVAQILRELPSVAAIATA